MGSDAPTEFEQAATFRASLRRFHRISEDAARQAGLTPRRHLLLLMIKGAPGGAERSTVSELCERLQLAQSTVTELVQRAEDAGLVRRTQARDDGRIAYLTPTPEEVITGVLAHHARSAQQPGASGPPPAPGYDPRALSVLFGRPL